MISSFLSSLPRRRGATLAAVFSLALGSVALLCGAGSVPIENLLPQGALQGDLNAGGHNLTNVATVSATNVVVSGSLTAPASFTLPFSQLSGTPVSLSGYGIADPVVLTNGSYANPAWLTGLAASKLTGPLPATSGSALTGLNAAALTGTLPNAVFPATLPAASGTNLTGIPYGSLTGTPALGTLAPWSPTGTADSSHYLRGDDTWATVAGTYSLPNATATTLGGVIVPASGGLSISSGSISANVGTTAGTVAAGNDSRISGALQTSSLGANVAAALAHARNGPGGMAATAQLGPAALNVVTFGDSLFEGPAGSPVYAAQSVAAAMQTLGIGAGGAHIYNFGLRQDTTSQAAGLYNGFGTPVTTTGTVTSGSASVAVTGTTTGITNGMAVGGVGIPPNTTVTISGSTLTLSNAATVSGTGVTLSIATSGSDVYYGELYPGTAANGWANYHGTSHMLSPAISGIPGVFIILLGTNDYYDGTSVGGTNPYTATATWESTYGSLVASAEADGYTVLALTIPASGDAIRVLTTSKANLVTFNNYIKANSYGATYVLDLNAQLPQTVAVNDPYHFTDLLHFSTLGAAYVGKYLNDQIFALVYPNQLGVNPLGPQQIPDGSLSTNIPLLSLNNVFPQQQTFQKNAQADYAFVGGSTETLMGSTVGNTSANLQLASVYGGTNKVSSYNVIGSTAATLTAGNTTVSVTTTSGFTAGMTVAGSGIPSYDTISSVGTGTLTLSNAPFISGSSSLYILAEAWRISATPGGSFSIINQASGGGDGGGLTISNDPNTHSTSVGNSAFYCGSLGAVYPSLSILNPIQVQGDTTYIGQGQLHITGHTNAGKIFDAGVDTTNNVGFISVNGYSLALVPSSGNVMVGTITDDGSSKLQVAGPTKVTSGNLMVDTAGYGLQVKEGTNAKQGTAGLAGGTVTVGDTSVTANSRIFLTTQAPGGTVGTPYVSARVAGTSFTISSTSSSDTSTVAYAIFEPAP